MAVTAPFQFARIPRAVWFPEWGPLVSHDVPFKDGYSGTIDIEIAAMTPLLIGGPRRKATDAKPGEVWPVQLPDGTYAIPGSSLQGMIRNILEIACFGKLGPWVDQRRFGIRDISGTPTGVAAYASRMTGKVAGVITPKTHSGWLQKSSDGKITITPCQHARIDSTNIGVLANGAAAGNLQAQLTAATNAKERYDAFLNTLPRTRPNKARLQVRVDVQAPTDAAHSCGPIWYTHCTAPALPATRSQPGQLVFTGKPSKGDGSRKKHFEFVFYNKPGAVSILINDDIWRDFKLSHSPPKGSGQTENPNWAYWKSDFDAGARVPIFYIEDVDATGNPLENTVAVMGTAFMFKLAHKNDTHDMLGNSNADHLDTSKYDLASLIFGGVGGEWLGHSLKRRASFAWAIADADAQAVEPQYYHVAEGKKKPEFAPRSAPTSTVLLSPKPSYFPIYVRQKMHGNQLDWDKGTRKNTEAYATYTPITDDTATFRKRPELAGSKIWPAPPDLGEKPAWCVPAPPATWGNRQDGQTDKLTTHVKLHALKQATKFKSQLHVHNLREAELGALLWALTWGGDAQLRHHIGMGKPFGMGSIQAVVTGTSLTPNANGAGASVTELIDKFKTTMRAAYRSLGDKVTAHEWEQSVQVAALLKAAQPQAQEEYMGLDNPERIKQRRDRDSRNWIDDLDRNDNPKMEPGPDSYIGARAEGHFLPSYIDGSYEIRLPPLTLERAAPNTAADATPSFSIGDKVIIVLGGRASTVIEINNTKPNSVRVKDDAAPDKRWYRPTDLKLAP
jgi:CRISPR-associated protein (TIGR03986 family)